MIDREKANGWTNRHKLTACEQEFVLNCLAARMTPSAMNDYLMAIFGKRISRQVYCKYKERYAEEIEQKRQAFRENSKCLDIPFIDQHERIAALCRYAAIEDSRGRYEAAAKHIDRIAQHLGELPHVVDVHGETDIAMLEAVEAALAKLESADQTTAGTIGEEMSHSH